MKFDEMNAEQLEARQAELAGMDPDSMTAQEAEERADELEAIRNELQARANAAAKAEEERQKVAESRTDAVIKTFEEDKKMDKRFAVDSPEYRDAFLRKLQGKELTMEERDAMTATAAIPTQTMNEIIHKLELNPLIAAVDVTNIPGYVTYPAENSIGEASWVPMTNASTDSADTLQSITLGAYKLIKTVQIDADVEAMSVDAFEAWLVARLANKIEKAIDAGIIAGKGSTSGECLGLSESLEATGTFSRAGITWKQLCAIPASLPGQYHAGASFVMSPSLFFGKVLGMSDSAGNRVAVLDPQGPVKYNILGFPCIIDGNCGTEDIYLGDLKAYKFNFARGVEVKSSDEIEFRKGSRVWRAMCLADGKLGDANAIVRYVATT